MFIDPIIQEKMERDGFLVLQICEPQAVDGLASKLEKLGLGDHDGDLIFNKNFPDMDSVMALQKVLSGFFLPKMKSWLSGVTGMEGTLYYKQAGSAATGYHQDWSSVDESKFYSWSIWLPLADVGADGGTFKVIKGSHRLFPCHRSATLDWPLKPYSELFDEYHQVVPIKKGQAIIFNHALIHGTTSNATNQKRTAAIMGLRSEQAQPIHYYQPEGTKSEVEVFALNDFFMCKYDYRSRPGEELGTFLKKISYLPEKLEAETVERRIQQGIREAKGWLRNRKFSKKGIIY